MSKPSASKAPFSKRHGFIQAKEITIREDAPENLRYFVLKTALDLEYTPSLLRSILCDVLHVCPDPNNWSEYPNVWDEAKRLISGCQWYKVYDVIEALHDHFVECDQDTGSKNATRFAELINQFFVEEGIGWQILRGEVVTRGSETFEGTVETAITVLEKDEKPTAAGHLRSALSALSVRPRPDTSGAVSHATNAVECVLGKITGTAMTLGKYLDRHPNLFHPSLKKGLDGVYGYASDEGARHGKEGTEPAREEAEFAVAVCAAVCTLLTRKRSQ